MEKKTLMYGIWVMICLGLSEAGCEKGTFNQKNCLNCVTLSWNPNSEPDLGGYKIYYGTKSRKYEMPIDVENSTVYTLSGLEKGTIYYFAVTAYDLSGNESGFSEEISKKYN